MQPTAFTTLLCTLETKECADFSRFHRYMFPRRQRAQRYLDFLLLYHPDYHSRKDLTKAFVFQSLHPGSTYDNKSLGNVFSYLKGQLETFLSWQYLMQTGFERDVFLAKVLRERSLSKAYYQQLTAAGRNLEKADVVGQRTLINYLEIKHGDYYSSLDNKLQHRDYKGSVFGQLLKSQELLNDLLATKYAAELQNRKRILGQVDQKVGEDDNLLFGTEKELIQLYRFFAAPYPSDGTEQDHLFNRAHAMFQRLKSQISEEDQSILISYLSNLAAHRMRVGKSAAYTPVLFKLNKYAVDQGFFLGADNMTPTRFLNIIEMGISVASGESDISWIVSFIETYRPKLPKGSRKAVYRLSLAFLHFARKEYAATSQILARLQIPDANIDIRCRYLSIQVLFHTEEEEFVLQKIRNFQQFLNRQQPYHEALREALSNFLKTVKELTLAKISFEELKGRFSRRVPIVCQYWLEEQLAIYPRQVLGHI